MMYFTDSKKFYKVTKSGITEITYPEYLKKVPITGGSLVNINGKKIPENIASYAGLLIHKWLPSLTFPQLITKKYCGDIYGATRDLKSKMKFIKKWNIDLTKTKKCKNYTSVEKCVKEEFRTINDIFIRELQSKFIKISSKNNDSVIVSPATCRMTIFESEKISKKIWVKGHNFSIANMLNLSGNKILEEHFNDASIIISRLAPEDYHRFHNGIAGTLLGIYKIPGNYLSVHPVLVNSSNDVFIKNTRKIAFIKTKQFGIVAVVYVGAICVGSITITNGTAKKLIKGNEFGYFEFGGSTIVTVMNNTKFVKEYVRNSKKGIETYVQVGDRIGSVAKANYKDSTGVESAIRKIINTKK